MDSDCREATKRAGLGGLHFRELRNWIFHGGGVGLTRAGSEVLVRELVPIIECITAALGQWAESANAQDLVWPVFREQTDPQVFIRIDQDEARYVPLSGDALLALGGVEEIAAYRHRLGCEPEQLQNFWEMVLERSTHLVGREREVRYIVEQLRTTKRKPWWWLFAAMGRGKSSVMAAVAYRLAESLGDSPSPKQPPVIVYFFRGGDARNTVDAFVRLAAGRLAPDQRLPPDPAQRERTLRQLLGEHQPFVLCDGLDELERDQPDGTKRLLAFAQAGGRWVFASRDVPQVQGVLRTIQPLWPHGLPAFADDDLKALLLNSELPRVRDAVLAARRGAETPDGTGVTANRWIDLVVSRCEGSPLYLELLLAQLASQGTVTAVRDTIDAMMAVPSTVPRGLDALYHSLVNEFGTGDLAALATPALCLLARSREPLVPSVIADLLLSDDVLFSSDEHAATVELVEQIVRRFGPVLTWERVAQERGVRIDHDSFRHFLANDAGHARSWARAGRIWARAAESPERFPSASAHLLRHGVDYLLAAGRVDAATRLMTSLEWLHRRLEILGLEGIEQTLDDFSRIELNVEEGDAADVNAWRTFIGRHAHLLRRATSEWGPERILHQLVSDYPPSPTAESAANALSKRIGEPPLRLLPGAIRPTQPPSLRFTLDRELVDDGISEVLQLQNRWIVAWAEQGTVEVVRPDGREVSRFAVDLHPRSVYATFDDRLVYVGLKGEVELWDPGTGLLVERFENAATAPPKRPESVGKYLTVGLELDDDGEPQPGPLEAIACFLHPITGERSEVRSGQLDGALELMDGGVATWSIEDRALRVWDLPRYDVAPGDWVREITDLGNGRVLSRMSGSKPKLQVWSAETGREEVEEDDDWPVLIRGQKANMQWPSTVILDDKRQIEWDIYGISVVSRSDGALLARFEGHERIPTGALPIRRGAAVVSWAFHDALRVWDTASGAPLSTFSLHHDTVLGALESADGRIVSWSRDGSCWVWDPQNARPSVAAFHPTVDMRVVVHPSADRLVADGAWSSPLFMKLERMAGE
jgi:WD40 repeat protein